MKINFCVSSKPVAHCGDCGERLRGNGSPLLPYTCDCGVWGYFKRVGEFMLIKINPAKKLSQNPAKFPETRNPAKKSICGQTSLF